MKHSIRVQFALVYMALIAAPLLGCFLVNHFFLEKYYTNHKENTLQQVYEFLDNSYDWRLERDRVVKYQSVSEGDSGLSNIAGSKPEEFVVSEMDNELQRLCSRENINYLVIDSDGLILKANLYNVNLLKRQLLDDVFFYDTSESPPGKILDASDNYVRMIKKDSVSNIDFIEMWGFLTGGEIFILRSPCESVREGARLANRFLGYAGLVAVVIGAFIAYFISDRVTNPIRELTSISEKMAKLDFDTRYTKNSDTEIGHLGENMNLLSAKLESTISELKTANLELKKDVEQKERVDNIRREFLSNVSHELKTPIALIQGYAEGLTENVNDEESRDFYCEVIIDEARRMNRLVQSLLTLDNIESGRDTPVMERVDISEMLSNLVASLDILIKQKGVLVRNDAPANLNIWGDKTRCEDIIRNYLSNALNHIEGEKILHIKAQNMGDNVRISVFNTGKPIPEENLPHIWDKFYKVDKARTREYGGSGVGLSIVKAACESMNMAYGITNYENGVEFWFESSVKA